MVGKFATIKASLCTCSFREEQRGAKRRFYETLQRSSSGPRRPYGKREDPGDEVGLSRANASARENQPTRGVISRALAFRSLHYP